MTKQIGKDRRAVVMFYNMKEDPEILNVEITQDRSVNTLTSILGPLDISTRDIERECPKVFAEHFEDLLGDIELLEEPSKGYYIQIAGKPYRLVLEDFSGNHEIGLPFIHYKFWEHDRMGVHKVIERYRKLQIDLDKSRKRMVSEAIQGPGFIMFRDY